jgi:hypothetical protein
MKRIFDFTVQVVYDGTVQVEADNLPDAEKRVRELVKPQGVFCKDLFGENETFNTDAFPTVHFLHHREIPDTEPLSPPATEEEVNSGKATWCQWCENEFCCLHGTDSLVHFCGNYRNYSHTDKEEQR